jgi:hypothetical protein
MNRGSPVSLAKTFVHYMRMGDAAIRLGRVRILGDDSIRWLITGPIPFQPYLEWTQRDARQLDRRRRRAEPAVAQVVVHVVELVLNGHKIAVDITD